MSEHDKLAESITAAAAAAVDRLVAERDAHACRIAELERQINGYKDAIDLGANTALGLMRQVDDLSERLAAAKEREREWRWLLHESDTMLRGARSIVAAAGAKMDIYDAALAQNKTALSLPPEEGKQSDSFPLPGGKTGAEITAAMQAAGYWEKQLEQPGDVIGNVVYMGKGKPADIPESAFADLPEQPDPVEKAITDTIQFLHSVEENGRIIADQVIDDPFIRTVIRPKGWRAAWSVLRGRMEFCVMVRAIVHSAALTIERKSDDDSIRSRVHDHHRNNGWGNHVCGRDLGHAKHFVAVEHLDSARVGDIHYARFINRVRRGTGSCLQQDRPNPAARNEDP
jgi:hypothetical protein